MLKKVPHHLATYTAGGNSEHIWPNLPNGVATALTITGTALRAGVMR